MTKSTARRAIDAVIGDDIHFTLEHRLFNTVSLLNAVTNIGGIAGLLVLQNAALLVALNLGIGVVFLGFYLFARFRGGFRALYWPFVLTILVFLFANILFNAGTMGGAAWYLIPAVIIATALAPRTVDAVVSTSLFAAAAVAILAIEQYRPSLILPYAAASDRILDVAPNLLFALLFSAGLVLLFAKSLNAERRRSDRLLLNVLPEEVADELKRNARVVPVHYESATVLFTDFVGFTQISATLSPEDLIARLDRAFQEFDRITQEHHVEKIKTIGDAYMAVGGIPRSNATHAVDCALAALELARETQRLKDEYEQAGDKAWSVRVGIHTGPIVAGVIGTEKFAYDVWGDTVNTASRLESSGVPGQINISDATHRLVADLFVCEHRGLVAAKGKGELEMYLLTGIRPELTDDGVTPNARFRELYAGLDRAGHASDGLG